MRTTARGFTLFEMVVVVAIFVLLAGGIYATVNAAVRATATLTEENLQIQRLNAFVALVRRTFHNLPANARFSGGCGPMLAMVFPRSHFAMRPVSLPGAWAGPRPPPRCWPRVRASAVVVSSA
jgi:prepilin-type N-terminal cleavage/methylation domain